MPRRPTATRTMATKPVVHRTGVHFWGPDIYGVPLFPNDRKRVVQFLFDTYWKDRDEDQAMQTMLRLNESVVSRCGVLVQFSSITMSILLFAATRQDLITGSWQRAIYYVMMILWAFATAVLVLSLAHKLPPLNNFNDEVDFKFTSELYVKRLAYYNVCLLVSVASFISCSLILMPIRATFVDHLFK